MHLFNGILWMSMRVVAFVHIVCSGRPSSQQTPQPLEHKEYEYSNCLAITSTLSIICRK